MIFYSRNFNAFLAENQNGPYGPYEQLLKDGNGNYWQKKGVVDEKWNFGGVGNFKIQFWGPGRDFQGFYKTKNDFKEYSGLFLNNSGQIFIYVYIIFNENREK